MRIWTLGSVAALILACACTPASAATVGSTSVGTAIDSNSAGRAQDYRGSADTGGSVDTLHVYLDGSNTANTVGLAIFSSRDDTHADRLLGRCGIYGIPARTAGWRSCTIAPAPVAVTSGGTYWLTILQPAGSAGTLQFRTDVTQGRTFGSASSSLTSITSADPWSNGPDWGAQTGSIYADGATSPTPTPTPSPTPSPSPTPTPTPTPGGCAVSTPNVADGPDPYGGCWPGPSNTGVPDGTALSAYTGPCSITTANAVIDSKTVNCTLNIRAQGVQIRNSQINGSVWIDPPGSGSVTVTDSTIDAGPVDATHNDGASSIGKSDFTAIRVETVRGIRGAWCEYSCTLQDSYVHGQDPDEGGHAHESGVRMGSGQSQVIRHNTLRCDAPDIAPDAGCSADLTGYGDFAPIQNNTIDRNLMLATTGGTCAYGGSSGDNGSKPYGNQANHIVFSGNVFQRRSSIQSSGKCGFWFPISDFDSSRPGNVWTGNVWDDGATLPPDG